MRLLLMAALAGCASDDVKETATAPDTNVPIDPADLPGTIDEDRPAPLRVPAGWDGESPLPLVILLHGYGATGPVQDAYFGVGDRVDTLGFALLTPDGTMDGGGSRFWNATDACCDFEGSNVDDVAYLDGLVDEVQEMLPVDRVYFLGHSNGGFMSYRMACESSERVTAIASLAGATFLDESDCAASEGVDVLQIHGTNDTTILYDGTPYYPGAEETVQRWADRSGCAAPPTEIGTADLDGFVDGAETVMLRYADGCGADAELWRMDASGHIPAVNDAFADGVLGWLLAHP